MKDIIFVIGPPPPENTSEDERYDKFKNEIKESLDKDFRRTAKWPPPPLTPEGKWREIEVDLEALDKDQARGRANPMGLERDLLEMVSKVPGLGSFLASLEREATQYIVMEMIEGLTKENASLRTMCDEYKSMIEKLRAKIVEQDEVIGKLARSSSTGKTSLSS